MHSRRAFLDSSFWIAFRDARQTHSARRKDCVTALFLERTHSVSTPFVVMRRLGVNVKRVTAFDDHVR